MNAAKRAFHRNSEWRLLDAQARGKLLYKFAELVQRDKEYLVELETYNNGMILSNCRRFVEGGIDFIKYNAGLADKIVGTTIPVGECVYFYTFN